MRVDVWRGECKRTTREVPVVVDENCKRDRNLESMHSFVPLTKEWGPVVPARCRPNRRIPIVAFTSSHHPPVVVAFVVTVDAHIAQRPFPSQSEQSHHDVQRRLDVRCRLEGGIPPLIAIIQLIARDTHLLVQSPTRPKESLLSSSITETRREDFLPQSSLSLLLGRDVVVGGGIGAPS
jgi:hypothetical protein